jgi:uncharacterized repeat protein (TIGR01451 family)
MSRNTSPTRLLLILFLLAGLFFGAAGQSMAGVEAAPASAPGDVDLSLTMTIPPADNFPNVGETVTFTIKVTNNDPLLTATGITVRDVLPVGLTYKSDDGGGTYNKNTGIWAVGALGPAAPTSVATLRITATVTQIGPFTNAAEIWHSDQGDPDSTPANGVPGEDDYAFAVVTPKYADLFINNVASNSTPIKNELIDITLKVTNTSLDDATNVTVKDLLPGGLTYQSDTDGTYNPTTGIWAVGTLLGSPSGFGTEPGTFDTITITVKVTTAAKKTNIAEVWTSDQYDPDSTPGNGVPTEDDYKSFEITPQVADLSLTKTIDNPAPSIGDLVKFTITVTNDGPDLATNVIVQDALPPDYSFVSDNPLGSYNNGTGKWTIGNLAIGATASLEITATTLADGATTNWAEVWTSDQFDPDSEPGDGSKDTDDDDGVPAANLSLVKSVDLSRVNIGSKVVFTITVSNAGPAKATNVSVMDKLPAGMDYVSDTSAGAYTPGSGLWMIGSLAKGKSVTLKITAKAIAAGVATNWAEVWTSNQIDPNSIPGDSSTNTDDDASAAVTVSYPAMTVLINEVAWAGTSSTYSSDEWIELYNPTAKDIDLTNWKLQSSDGTPTINLSGTITAGNYFLLENDTDDMVVSDIPADQFYSGSLLNTGESLTLYDASGSAIDTANGIGGWPAGSSSTYGSMERKAVVADSRTAWLTNTGAKKNGLNRGGGAILGTPKRSNSPIPTPAKSVIISEVAWMGTAASPADEWIELYNNTTKPIDLKNWKLRTTTGVIVLSGTILPNDFFLLESTNDDTVKGIKADLIYLQIKLLNNDEKLTLYDPYNNMVDTANSDKGKWPAGDMATFGSMERAGYILDDVDSSWFTHIAGVNPRCGHDANWNGVDPQANRINGTPKCPNWAFTVTATPSPTPTPSLPRKTVVITEVAWMGTSASSADEWIELFNATNQPINLSGWKLISYRYSSGNFIKNLDISLTGVLNPRVPNAPQSDTSGYFLLESDEDAVSNIDADQLYSGSLYDSGEILFLCSPYEIQNSRCNIDGKGVMADYVNANLTKTGGIMPWPAGSASTDSTMERKNLISDDPTNYFTHVGPPSNGADANGNHIKGTPKHPNWAFEVTSTPRATATPTRTPTRRPAAAPILVLNEFLARAGTDWNKDGKVDVNDEFIEVINAGTVSLNLSGYKLDDYELDAAGKVIANAFQLPSQNLKPGERALFFASQTGIRLEDSGDTVRLLRASNSSVVDAVTYRVVKSLDSSVCRYTDGYGSWIVGCFPTPGLPNKLTGTLPIMISHGKPLPVCALPDSTPMEFVLAECGEYETGSQIWNTTYWDSWPGEGTEIWRPDEHNKWLAIYQ